MATFISQNPDQTLALGEEWGHTAVPGLVIALNGDLGAGKTQLVKGLARGLGVAARVQSPTFALLISYTDGRMPLYHLDLYRLTHPEQFAAAGLEEYLRPNGVTVIEWAQNFFGPQPRDPGIRLRWVKLEAGRSETERHITYEDLGA